MTIALSVFHCVCWYQIAQSATYLFTDGVRE